MKAMSMLPTLNVTKVPLEVPHDRGTALLRMGMSFYAPFFMKGRSLLEPESSRSLIVLFLTISISLVLFLCLAERFWHDLAYFCYKLDLLSANSFEFSTFTIFFAN